MPGSHRNIEVNGVTYGWRVTAKVVAGGSYTSQLMAFRTGTSGAALRIVFTDGPQGGAGPIPRRGLVSLNAKHSPLHLNLNSPGTVATLILHAVQAGWTGAGPMQVDDGFTFALAAHGRPAP